MMPNDISSELVKSPWVAGAAGAIVALHGAPGASWPQRMFNVAAGALVAGYASPIINQYFGLSTPELQSASAFLCGLFGLNFSASLLDSIRASNWLELLPWRR